MLKFSCIKGGSNQREQECKNYAESQKFKEPLCDLSVFVVAFDRLDYSKQRSIVFTHACDESLEHPSIHIESSRLFR